MASLSLIAHPFLTETTSKLRSKPVPWDGYQRASLITPEELTLIKKIDKQPPLKRLSIYEKESPTYVSLFLHLLSKLVRIDTVQAVLISISDMLEDAPTTLDLFYEDKEWSGALLKAMGLGDEFVQLKALQILSVLVANASESNKADDGVVKGMIVVLGGLINGTSPSSKDISIQALSLLLSLSHIRILLWDDASSGQAVTTGLLALLRSPSTSPQLSYQIIFSLWELTFNSTVAESINARFPDLIPLLGDVGRGANKEKVVRVVVATLRNLAQSAPEKNLPAMLVSKLLPFVQSLTTRKWSDDEIVEDIQYLVDVLKERSESLSTYEEYTAELTTGHLSSSSLHTSETFWRDNAPKLTDNNNEMLGKLVKLINNPMTDASTLGVAVADLGMFMKFCDRGKSVVTELGVKTRIMELIAHENPEVRYRALISVQKLISVN